MNSSSIFPMRSSMSLGTEIVAEIIIQVGSQLVLGTELCIFVPYALIARVLQALRAIPRQGLQAVQLVQNRQLLIGQGFPAGACKTRSCSTSDQACIRTEATCISMRAVVYFSGNGQGSLPHMGPVVVGPSNRKNAYYKKAPWTVPETAWSPEGVKGR